MKKIIILLILLLLVFGIRHTYVQDTLASNLPINLKLPDATVLESTDKIIWSYWSGSKMPLSVKMAIYTWKKYNPDFYIVVLKENTVSRYVDSSIFPTRYSKLKQAHKADVIRLAVLEKYGGYWCDATYYLGKSLEARWEPKEYDIGGYYQDIFTTDLNRPVLENWFLAAPKNSALVTAWRKEFYRGVDYKNPKVYIRELERTVDLQKIRLDLREYLMMHCAFLKVIQEQKYQLKVFSALDNGPMSYLHKCKWNPVLAIIYLLTTTETSVPDAIKLRGGERNRLEKCWFLYRTDSIIDRCCYNFPRKSATYYGKK